MNRSRRSLAARRLPDRNRWCRVPLRGVLRIVTRWGPSEKPVLRTCVRYDGRMERRVEHQLPDVLAIDHPAVRRVVPTLAVWVDLSALTGRARGDWSRSGMNVTTHRRG